jgi:hypothetical protein
MVDYLMPDLTKPYGPGNGGFDFGTYINHSRSLAVMMVCINNSGGHSYIVSSKFFEKYPTAHQHMRNHMKWLEEKTDEQFNKEQETFINNIQAMVL